MNDRSDEFEDLYVLKKKISEDNGEDVYLVYRNDVETITVKAVNALEAIRKSGVLNPIKVERKNLLNKPSIEEEKLENEDKESWDEHARNKLKLSIGTDVSGLIVTNEDGTVPDM